MAEEDQQRVTLGSLEKRIEQVALYHDATHELFREQTQ